MGWDPGSLFIKISYAYIGPKPGKQVGNGYDIRRDGPTNDHPACGSQEKGVGFSEVDL